MTYFTKCTLPSRNYFEALETAEQRALHSFFDQHVIEDDELGYRAVDEGVRLMPSFGGGSATKPMRRASSRPAE